MPSLIIQPAPFARSLLSIQPSPHSPLSPLSPLGQLQSKPGQFERIFVASQMRYQHLHHTTYLRHGPPETPLPWLWQCHICSQAYPLGTTRRCLDDGHHFCAGEPQPPTVRGTKRKGARSRRSNRGKPCSSEFDYHGWKEYNEWRRAETELRRKLCSERYNWGNPRRKTYETDHHCVEDCDYPSNCRWAAHLDDCQKIEGLRTSEDAATDLSNGALFPADVSATSFEEILGVSTPRRDADPCVNECSEDKGEITRGRECSAIDAASTTESSNVLVFPRNSPQANGKVARSASVPGVDKGNKRSKFRHLSF